MTADVAGGPTTEQQSRAAKDAAYRVHNILRTHSGETVPLHDPQDDELTVPRAAAELLRQILSAMAAGVPVSVIPAHAELTTQQAADLLNVSRPHVIKLLEQGEIEYRLVGTHRRVLASSLRAFKESSERRQTAAADELTRLTEEMGLY
ncbi:helix-turn-helix domain-containing protein [Nakamurella flava]|jgi:excisionase family DNA binding protein|uniref:Helix-turn-helix domain-containing protein n=1 Tax=Nakamurella flava TaxID=2576308 RepID=A0A4U6QA52_9ACTN|nr:helix-turn-helix domain-containing protein [Nakamurella flava]TKV56791.1 helix-turn-helix domain-containing protein [Nakamurella flava]